MAPKKPPKNLSLRASKNASFWRKYEIILPRKNLPIWDPNLPLRNPKSPYLALRKYHMYENGQVLQISEINWKSDVKLFYDLESRSQENLDVRFISPCPYDLSWRGILWWIFTRLEWISFENFHQTWHCTSQNLYGWCPSPPDSLCWRIFFLKRKRNAGFFFTKTYKDGIKRSQRVSGILFLWYFTSL